MSTASPQCIPEKDVIIVGGSLAGLMHGITLLHLGHRVRILEQSAGSQPESHMAGVGLAGDVQAFLARHMPAHAANLSIRAECLQTVDEQGRPKPFLAVNRELTSWDALYARLRAAFDEAGSAAGKPRGEYLTGRRVTGVRASESEAKVRIELADAEAAGGKAAEEEADLVLGADGPNSAVRRALLPSGAAERRYAGYVAWRGVVREDQVSERTRAVFRSNITYIVVAGGHAIVYNIPGEGGSLAEGERYLNFCWYADEDPAGLDDLMTGTDGVRHRASLPPGKVRAEVWARQRERGRRLFTAAYREVLDGIAAPFIHLIADYWSPRAAFAGGKVLLVGDAQTLVRPHIAYSTNQAAFHCRLVEQLMRGEMSVDAWDAEVSRLGYLHWSRSVWFGEWFRRPLYSSIGFGARYWMLAIAEKVRYWAGMGQVVLV